MAAEACLLGMDGVGFLTEPDPFKRLVFQAVKVKAEEIDSRRRREFTRAMRNEIADAWS